MLEAVGVSSIDELFDDIPEAVRLGRPLELPDGKPETEVYDRLSALAARNAHAEAETSFLGAGMYDHYVPAIVDAITSRSEFLTPYTPYQPEISQGGLQVMFEFQTAMSELTGLPVSNAALYEGPSAVASAAYLAIGATGRKKLVASRGVHPHSRESLVTYGAGYGTELVEVALDAGVTDAAALADAIDDETAAVFLQQPNFLGAVEDIEALGAKAKEHGALVVVACDPIALSILRPPGECGADVAVGEGQPLGNRLDYGGPSFGFFCATDEHIRRMPGRIAGETTDVDGRRGFVLTLQTREQHIRREKATHNICTAQALNALGGMVHLAWLGKRGFLELGELLVRRTAYARERLAAVDGVELLHEAPVVREFAVALDAPVAEVLDRCAAEGIGAGYPLGRDYPEHENGLLVAITERRSRQDIDRLADVLGEPLPSCAARRSRRGWRREREAHRRGPELTETPMQRDRATTIYRALGRGPARRDPARGWGRRAPDRRADPQEPPARPSRRELPEVSEPEIVRHYNRISRRNFDLDTGFYPLGSCTMKHNPRLNERVAALPGHARLHPAQEPKRAQGALELMWLLQQSLSEICGLPHVSLQPSAGSHGELAGLLLTRAYHADRGENRTKVLTPDTAHGTNPATVTMAGYEVVKLASNEKGGIDLDDLRSKAGRRHRLPDAHQPEHARAVRREHRGDRLDRPRGGRHPLLRRRQPERDHGPLPAGRHGLRHRPRQPAQVLLAAPRRRWPGRRADRGERPDRALPAAAAGGAPRAAERGRAHLRPRLRAAQVDRPAARLPGQLRRLRALLRLHPQPRRRRPAGGLGDRGAERQLSARQAERGEGGQVHAGRLRQPPDARVRPLRAPRRRRSSASRRSTSPSGCSTSACTRRPSTSRCSSTRR